MVKNHDEYNIEEIFPPLDKQKVELFCKEMSLSLPKDFSISKIPKEIENSLIQVYINKNLKTKNAIKLRFLQYFEFSESLSNLSIVSNGYNLQQLSIDLILSENKSDKCYWVFIIEFLNPRILSSTINEIKQAISSNLSENNEYVENLNGIYFVCSKIDRRVNCEPIPLTQQSKMIDISFFLEFQDKNRPFRDEDLILVDDLQFRGYNFGSIEDILDVIKKKKGKGKYQIFIRNQDNEESLVWEGILFPNSLYKSKQ